jgi:cell division protein FtsZ
MAMMGSAIASGNDRARRPGSAVRNPLFEDVISPARQGSSSTSASSGLRMKEYRDVMTTIKEFTADDALVIAGTVIDDTMEDQLRVTMIATGLGGAQAVRREQRAPNMTLVEPQVIARTGTDGVGVTVENVNYEHLDAPAVMRKRERGIPAAPAFDATEIPAFLRKQAD